MSKPCHATEPSDCHRNYCVRTGKCAEREASAPAPQPPHALCTTPLYDLALVEFPKQRFPLLLWQGLVKQLEEENHKLKRPAPSTQPAAPSPAVPDTFKAAGESDDAWIDRITGAQPPAPASRVPLSVTVFYLGEGDDPFVCECNGKVTAAVLVDIDKALQANEGDYFPSGPGTYKFNVTHFDGQYGFEGRCELAPGWEFENAGFEPLPKFPGAHGIHPASEGGPDA